MAVEAGNQWRVLVGVADPPTEAVGKAFDLDDDPKLIKADATTNDSAGNDEHKVVGASRTISFKVYADRSNAGQEILRTAQKNRTQIYVAYQELGLGSGKPQEKFLASVEMKRNPPLRGLINYTVTLERSGATDDTAQS